jgi:N-acyl-D-aspartate/D-glutamate deacylase
MVISYKMPTEQIPAWLRLEGITIGSDGMPIDPAYGLDTPYAELPAVHPRSAGAHARSLRMAREHDIPLMHVFAAMSYRVAKHLGDTGLCAMHERGRLQTGMVADITVFDSDNSDQIMPPTPRARCPARASTTCWSAVAWL